MLTNILIGVSALVQSYGNPPSANVVPVPADRPAPVASTPPAAAVAAVPGRTLKDLPGATISYFDVAGKTGPAIDKSLKRMLSDPAAQDAVRLFSWDVGTQITKMTKDNTCTVQSAKSTLTAKVRLPRLAEQAKVRKDVMAKWTPYVIGVENEAAANLWFLNDRLRGAEQSLVGMPCDKANAAWNAKLDDIKAQLNAFIARRASTVAAPAPQPST